MIGVTIHHVVACLSFGVSLGKQQTKSKLAIILTIVGLSLFESGGLAIGLGLEQAPEAAAAILFSFAGGTFIYIACTEILANEFDNSTTKIKYLKFGVFIIGAAIITCLWFLHGEH